MRKGSSPWLYTTLLIEILLSFRDVRSALPRTGPSITSITNVNSTSLNVTWRKLSVYDSNGRIFGYRVCYRVFKQNTGGICTKTKDVSGVNNIRVILTGLMKGTTYDVAILPESAGGGYAPVGNIVSHKTLLIDEGVPGVPIIDTQSTIVSLTTISLKWSPPFQLNGVITKYKVCWLSTDSSRSCKDTSATQILSYVIPNLRPGTTYDILLSAFTKIGEGPAAATQRKTNQSELDGNKLRASSIVAVSDDTTQIGFTLPRIKSSESSKIQYFYVIVKRWSTIDNENVLRATPQGNLTNFDNSNNGKKAYITIIKNNYKSDMKIIVGDNSKTTLTARRKRRHVNEYRNAPLNENTQYAIFIRVFYDKDRTSFQSSDILVKATAFADVNECEDGLCGFNANCTNTIGSFMCECQTGFKGNGTNCTDAGKDGKDSKLLICIIVFPIVVAILLILVAYFVYQNRTLKKSIAKMTHTDKETRNATKNDHPFDIVHDNRDDEMNYDDVRNDDPTNTALNRTAKEDEDHFYTSRLHLRELEV